LLKFLLVVYLPEYFEMILIGEGVSR